jgi:predicted nucleotidyltransferase component of viral defense system
MPVDDLYRRQVALLVRTIPLIAGENCFAVKGGTAINLFVRDMPRLSVDIDLTYLPVADRASSLKEIDAALKRIAQRIGSGIPGAHVNKSAPKGETSITKLVVQADGVQMKIEVTPVLRGCVYEPRMRTVSPRVEDEFGFAEIQVVSFADLYAGKLVAALDRQHPRDLFDVRDLLANEGIGDDLRKAFIVYLLSHNRLFAEVLDPTRLDITEEFERGFRGMTDEPVTIEELVRAREELIADITGRMPEQHRRFLLSVKRGQPEWELLDMPGAESLPAVQWRLGNLEKMDKAKRDALAGRLAEVLKITD